MNAKAYLLSHALLVFMPQFFPSFSGAFHWHTAQGRRIMGLIEMALVGLCLNATCQSNSSNDFNVDDYMMITESLEFKKKLLFDNLARELKGTHLKVATGQNGVLSYTVKENNIWVGKGVAFDLLHILQEKFDFQYSVILPKQNSLGSNKSGIFGLLSNNQVDLSAAFLPMTSIYWKYAHFATTLDVGEWVIVLKRPQASATGSGLLAPFNVDVWLLILVSLLAVGPIIYLIISVQSNVYNNKEEKPIHLTECMWFVYGALLKQGTVLKPAADSSRLIFASWWMFITILTAFYTANLTAFLTLSEFTLPLKTPEDIRIKKYPWVSHSGSVIQEAASNRYEELYRVLRHSKGVFVRSGGTEILRTWVTNRNYMYIAERPTVDILMYQEYLNKINEGIPEPKRCTYVLAPFSVFKRPRTFAYAKTFKYGLLFDRVLNTLVEAGIAKYMLNNGIPNAQICPLNLGSKERQLRNADLLLTYYIVGFGFSISVLIFITETLVKFLKIGKDRERTNKRNQSLRSDLNFGQFAPPPPPYDAIFFQPTKTPARKKQIINGRDYWVIKSVENGSTRLIPVRTPSALLFDYAN